MARKKALATPPAARSRVFIGSSSEYLHVAEVAQHLIDATATAEVWNVSPEFKQTQSTLDGLLSAIERYDYAFFILSLDDRLTIRARKTVSVRDNVLFEFGLFLGQLGADRVAAIMQTPTADVEARIPADLEGITITRFRDSKNPDDLRSSIASALKPFLDVVRRLGRRKRKINLIKSWGFDAPTRTYEVTISGIALRENWTKCERCHLALVAKVKDGNRPFEDDDRISIGRPRRCSDTDREDFELAVELGPAIQFKKGDVIEAHLLLTPADVDFTPAATITDFVRYGCDIVDNCGHTVKTTPRKPKGDVDREAKK
ncbi:TIR domain-containing protein [Paludisphaera borealis]|uniref:CD-NTase-associated protein 12/Pycsar effector protein TIR domain-containing protein n=1 Tax=Paludisphaera borealis TaxID=1387353 RepID=A0A1U7CSF3_9BACT|nr:TIR domain-containing protein [Paludisphaera borealis]APW61874.1 hypothetical protein BSF38_03404 [Paludisphaera borealis]